jgi:hypothetical protein
MFIDNMTVRDAIKATGNVGSRFDSLYPEIEIGDKGSEEVRTGKAPFFTGLKSLIVGAPGLYQVSDDVVVSGPVKLVGQWVWWNPKLFTSDPVIWSGLYVCVPLGNGGTFQQGSTFNIGQDYIDPDDDLEVVRQQIIEGKNRIYELAAEYGIEGEK